MGSPGFALGMLRRLAACRNIGTPGLGGFNSLQASSGVHCFHSQTTPPKATVKCFHSVVGFERTGVHCRNSFRLMSFRSIKWPSTHSSNRLFSWKHPKPESALRRMRSGKKKKYKMKPLRSLQRRFFLDEKTKLLKYRGPGVSHNNWKKSNRLFRKLSGWKLCTRKQTNKLKQFMKL